jgi:hypothetical protein
MQILFQPVYCEKKQYDTRRNVGMMHRTCLTFLSCVMINKKGFIKTGRE